MTDLAPARPALRGLRPAALVWGAAALCLVPLLVTPVLPLIDFYAHVARYFALARVDDDPALALNYAPAWALLPNLGLDVIGVAVMERVPPLLGAKILGALIVLAPVLGALALARALHGRVAATHVALAGLLAYSFVLTWGFANFILGLGLALAALGLWIALAHRPGAQLATGIAAGMVIMLVHGLVFGLWGLMLLAVELAQVRAAPPMPRARVLGRIARLGLVAAGPVVLFLMTRTASADGGVTQAFGNLAAHAGRGQLWPRLLAEAGHRVDGLLRVAESTWPWADRLFGLVLWGTLALAFAKGALRLDTRLRLAAALAAALVVVMPPNLFGVGHLDDRMPLVLLALLAAGAVPGRAAWPAPVLGGLFALHLAMVTAGWAQLGTGYRAFLDAAQALPRGGLAQAHFGPGAQGRDASRACKPLLFLLLLQNGTAVSTFANPTQQPLRIVGPLRAALDGRGAGAAASDAGPQDRLPRPGFDVAVVCDTPPAAAGTGGQPVARQGSWALFRRPAGRARRAPCRNPRARQPFRRGNPSKETVMSDLVIVAFPDEATAFEARAALVGLQKEYLIEMEDVVIVTRAEDSGDVKLHQAVNLTAAGAAGGTMWGTLVGLLFLNPLLGAAVGAGTGALVGRFSDIGINDDFIRDVGRSLERGGSAICVLIRKMTGDKVLERLEPFRAKGRVVQTSLSKDSDEALRRLFEEIRPLGNPPADQLGGGREQTQA